MIDSIDDTHREKLHIELLLLQIDCLHNQLNFVIPLPWLNKQMFEQDQLTFICSKSTIKTLEKGAKYVRS